MFPLHIVFMTEAKAEEHVHESSNEQQQQQQQQGQQETNTGTSAKRQVTGGWMLAGSYFIGWLVILIIFKAVYDRYRARSRASRKKWFPSHPEKEAYEALLADDNATEEGLRKALLRRAMTDIKRIWQLQEEKDSLYKLMRAGSVPESLWANYKDADQEMQLEIYDLQAEAETFKPGWSQGILKEAAQLVQKERELQALKTRIEQEQRAAAADPTKNEKEKKAVKTKLEKVQKVAIQMINKQYGGSQDGSVSGSGSETTSDSSECGSDCEHSSEEEK